MDVPTLRLGLLSLALTSAACNALFGIEDLAYTSDGGSNAGGASGGPAIGGMGGDATSGGGTGGEASSDCVLGTAGDCSPGSKCTVIDTASGQTGCISAGNRGPWTRCVSDADCVGGTWCDGVTQVCAPLCESAVDCDDGSECIDAKGPDGDDVVGLRRCTSNCNPLDASPCDASFGPITCFYDAGDSLFDCAETNGLAEGSSCNGITDCGAGLVCVTDVCGSWCTPNGTSCPENVPCTEVSPQVTWQNMTLGVCI